MSKRNKSALTLYKFSDTVKTSNLNGFAHTQVAFLDKMGTFLTDPHSLPGTRGRKGTTDWDSDEIEIRAPEEATGADIRCFVVGKGKAWFDKVSLEELPWG